MNMISQPKTMESIPQVRQEFEALKVEYEAAQARLVRIESNVSNLTAEHDVLTDSLKQCENERVSLIAGDDPGALAKCRKRITDLKSRIEEVTETLPIMQGQLDSAADAVNRLRDQVLNYERNVWAQLFGEIHLQERPEAIIEYFERLCVCASLGHGNGLPWDALPIHLFPHGISIERRKEVERELRKAYGLSCT